MNIASDFGWSLVVGIIVTLVWYVLGLLTKKWSNVGAAIISSVVGILFVYFFGPPTPDHIFNAGDDAARIYSGLNILACGFAWAVGSAGTAFFLPSK